MAVVFKLCLDNPVYTDKRFETFKDLFLKIREGIIA